MPRGYTHLDLDDRRRIYRLRSVAPPVVGIARLMGRHPSTVHRELARNTHHDTEVPQASGCFPVSAHDMARRRRAGWRKLVRDPELRRVVVERLETGWSPKQIAGRLCLESDGERRLRHETIYRFAYSKEGRALGLARLLTSSEGAS